MKFLDTCCLVLGALAACANAVPASLNSRPFDSALKKRQAISSSANSSLVVDLGYGIYQGSSDQASQLNSWLGIRFAAAPVGSLRWQNPQAPVINRTQTIQATQFAPQCPQALYNGGLPGSAVVAAGASYRPTSSEDCLFLNVYAPSNATNLPVLVWIHGGGYGLGNGQMNMTSIINANNNGFIGVAIQYRLGAFGFLSSDELARNGVANAGIRDQTFALQWIQSYIHLFGGNASAVTISGESAGAGAVMLQTMAFGGQLGESLFSNAIAASPYLPMQYDYNAFVPSQSYYAFASQVGCFDGFAAGNLGQGNVFNCLVNSTSDALINASNIISASGYYGTWGFLPVTDHDFIQQAPSQQLLKKQVNGKRILSGNNANEGPLFVPQNITSEDALLSWLQGTLPLMKTDDISKVLLYYPGTNDSDSSSTPEFATSGYTGATAINQSSIATGQQQRANNIYAEMTFVCPSFWLAEAFTNNGRESYKYQFSVLPALHGADVSAYFGLANPTQGAGLVSQFQKIWGNFIMNDNPSISANAGNANISAIANWPAYNTRTPYQVNLNQTGGTLVNAALGQLYTSYGVPLNTSFYIGNDMQPNFSINNAYDWEGGRGFRCDFWRSVADIVPS